MSALLMGRAFYVPTDGTSRLVLVALADHANDDGKQARPGIGRLAVKTGTSRRTVKRALAHLEDHGLISADGYRGGGRGNATNWAINVALLRLFADAYEDDPAGYEARFCSADPAGYAVRLDVTESERVSDSHPFETVKGDTCDRKGCHLARERVTELCHPNHQNHQEPRAPAREAPGDLEPVGGLVAEFHRRIGKAHA